MLSTEGQSQPWSCWPHYCWYSPGCHRPSWPPGPTLAHVQTLWTSTPRSNASFHGAEAQYTNSILYNLFPNSEKRFLPFFSFDPPSLSLQLQSTLKTTQKFKDVHLFPITLLKFLLVCALHIPLHKELHWHKVLSAGTTTSCYASTHSKHTSEQ